MSLMWIGSLALAGIWPFAGYYSKDMILEAAWAAGTGVGRYAFWLGIFAAFLTAFYSWRLIFLTFHGKPRADHDVMQHVHESPPVMLVPLVVLAVGRGLRRHARLSISSSARAATEFWRDSILVLPAHDSVEGARARAVLGLACCRWSAASLGIAIAWCRLYLAARICRGAWRAALPRASICSCSTNGISTSSTTALFVRPRDGAGPRPVEKGDGAVIDGFGPDGVSPRRRASSRSGASRLQTGYLYHYAFAMLIGVVALVSWYLLLQIG